MAVFVVPMILMPCHQFEELFVLVGLMICFEHPLPTETVWVAEEVWEELMAEISLKPVQDF
jgi:hypothetical protein